MDATQMISDFIVESDEEEHEEGNNNDRGDPLGKLCILKNEHIPEKEFPLFLGDNILGRDPNTCTLPLLAPSVSKQHATISLSVYRRKGCENEVEAVLWDLGSMNGTRKGHFKLTPNVRYALSEEDCLVVADIPCKYMKCPADVPKDTRTPQNVHLKARMSGALKENGSKLTGKTKSTAISIKTKDMLPDSEVMRGTPARMSCLSFEQTPTQPQGTLVRDSESESDEERSKVGDERRKTIVSDSDSYKSSPTCSTFMSPTNKVVPESEDESPITPSSSYKNRTHRVVSFNNEESDIDINRQELKKRVALEIVDDSEEEAGNDEAGSVLEDIHDKSGQPVLIKEECNASLTGGGKFSLASYIVPQFNMDSDTDVEEEEEKQTSAALVTSNNGQDSAQFHMDSDTDVDDNDSDKCSDPVLLSNTPKHATLHSIPVLQPKGISMDSDTDVEDGDLLSAATAKPTVSHTANTAELGANPEDFHLDSDTDVDEEETGAIVGEIPSRLDIKPVESTSAAPQSLHVESDTDDEGILSAAISKPPMDSAKPNFEILSNSDTNMEDNSSQVKPATSGPTTAEGQVDTDEDTDVNESIVSLAEEGKPDVTLDSDTDVEDKEAEIQEAGNNQIPILDREITPGIQVSLMQNSSTPVQLPEGNTEEIETQAFLSPYRCAAAPGRPVTFSSCLDSQDDDDFVVAETQSFILHDRGQDNPPKDPNISSVLESPVNEKDVSCTSGGNLQLELSDTSVLQCQAQALAMESTQAFVSVDSGVNLEETQPYAITTAEKELPVDIALQATQAYISDPYSDEEEETDEDQCTEQVLGASEVVTSSAVPESKHDRGTEEEQAEATQPGDVVSVAETQPMYTDEESDSEESGPVFRRRKPKQIQEEETQPFTNSELTVAETQPMETGSDENSPVFRNKKAKQIEEETQPVTNSELTAAETQPVEMMEDTESDEDSPVFKKKKAKRIQEGETQSLTNAELTVAETQPMEITENSGRDQDSPVLWRRKAKTLQPEEEAIQPIEMSKDEQTDEDSVQIFRKRIVKCLDSSEDDTQPHLDFECTVAQTQLIAVTEESGGEDLVPVDRTIQTPKQQPQEKDFSVAPTQPLVLSEDMASDEEDSFPAHKKRKAQKLEDTPQSLTNSQEDTKPTGSKERPAEGETSNVKVRRRRGGARLEKDKQELAEDVSSEPPKRQTKGKNKAAPVSRGRRGKAKIEQEDEGEKKETQLSKEDQQGAEEDTEEIQQEKQKGKEDIERLEKERIEQEEKEAATKIPKEKEEKQKEILEHEKKERMEKEKKEKEEMERLEKERIEQEEKEMAAKIQKEKEEKQKEKERKEKEQKEREEKQRLEGTKSAERQEEERQIKEHKTQLEMEKKEQLKREKQENFIKTKEDQTSRKGRRTARRTTAAPDSSTAADDDIPARRTRSRSNSSNSVGSERSVSSINSQTSRGTGRGRGVRRIEVQAEKPPSRGSNRRRTVAAEASIQTTGLSAPSSRSDCNNSLNYEVSISRVSSQGRGRGGRQRGRGRRTEVEPECVSVHSNQITIENAPQRGRKSTRICAENDEHKTEKTTQSVSSRWQSGAKEESSKCTPDHEEDQTNQEKASTSSSERRGGRKRQTENDGKNKSDLKGQEAQEEEEEKEKDVNPTVKRKDRARNTQFRKSVKGDVLEDSTESEKPKGRGRPSLSQRTKSEEQGDSGSSANNSMEQEANPRKQEPETLGCRVSRKRHSVDSDSSPVTKTPRSSTASPSTVGRSRGGSQAYKVLFTGVVDEAGEKVLSRLGGSLAKDVADMNCLVTDKVRRTVKFLCAVAKGVPIVTTQWLEKSGKAGTFLCPSAYIVKDREQEHKFNFNLQDSLRVANSQLLLKGYKIHVTKSVKPEPVHMKDIISCSGALFLPRMPSSKKLQTLVISCEEDWSLCGPALSSAIPVLSAEFILTGILQQKLDFEIHKLSGPVASAQTAGGRGRSQKKT